MATHVFKLQAFNVHVLVGGTASRGCSGFQSTIDLMLQFVSINLTLKQGLFVSPLKFIEKRSNFCLDQNALETPREHEELHEVG